MCGIAGVLDVSGGWGTGRLEEVVGRMTDTIRHRGPDDGGTWVDAPGGVALGSRRLAIIDLSVEGHQPMVSASGRHVVAFNGEIYNHRALRKELEADGARFRGHSDTEVMVEAIDRWGLRSALAKFNGMFAMALWDTRHHTLHLARDRLGEKPIYYGWAGRSFIFGSELKALRAHPEFPSDIDRDALTQFLRHKYVPAPRSIYRGIRKLPPATVMTVTRAGAAAGPVPYWSAAESAERGLADPFTGVPEEAAEEMESLLGDAVALRMEADVPLGAFLSGGIDSSTIVALMQSQSDRPVRTFTIGFHEGTYDEASHAKAVAAHLGTDHTELYVAPEEAMAVIPRLPELYDEPFADSSQIPTFLVSEMARRHVTVSLSGDGGDEVFGGYNRYTWGRDVWERIGGVPGPVRRAGARVLTAFSPATWDGVFRTARPLLPRRMQQRNAGEKLHKLAGALDASGPDRLYLSLVSHWKDPGSVVVGATEPPSVIESVNGGRIEDLTRRMMYLDTVSYLPDDILVKLDRATMGVSLEGRVPYLDHRVVELAWRLPLPMLVADGRSKLLLRRILRRHVPDELIDRPKWGFGVPIGSWLRGPLREWAEGLLDRGRLRQEGYLDPRPIRSKWAEHLAGRRNWQYDLWDVLMFQSWLEAARRPAGVP